MSIFKELGGGTETETQREGMGAEWNGGVLEREREVVWNGGVLERGGGRRGVKRRCFRDRDRERGGGRRGVERRCFRESARSGGGYGWKREEWRRVSCT